MEAETAWVEARRELLSLIETVKNYFVAGTTQFTEARKAIVDLEQKVKALQTS